MEINILLYFPGYSDPARRLADELGCEAKEISIHHFPDGESLVRIPAGLSGSVIIYVSLDRPDTKLVPLGFAAATARTIGARRVMLVAPYLCYMRQDKAFHRGEAVSQRILGRWLDEWFDMVLTVDAHLHRVHSIREVIPCGVNISAGPFMARFLKKWPGDPLLLGPDEESEQWVGQIGREAGLDYGVAHKERHGDRDVEISLPDIDVRGREVIIVDDVLSSGFTVAGAAIEARRHGAEHIYCMVTHALFAQGAEGLLEDSGVERIISTDTILHHSNSIHMAHGLAAAIREYCPSTGG
jgi:ribose-phosphate pyrophosphokinase